MTSPLAVALLQLNSAGAAPDANLHRGLDAIEIAAARGADLAVFPELWQVGYSLGPDREHAQRVVDRHAITLDDPYVGAFVDAARRLRIAVLVTFLERTATGCRNTALLVDRHGTMALHYSKVHLCEFSVEAALEPGDGFPVTTLDTAAGPVDVGVMICFDREFPEAARALSLGGAELILVPNACTMTVDRLGQLRARAFENMSAIALANYASPEHNGHSCLFDGMPFHPEGHARDQQVAMAGRGTDIVVAHLELEHLRRYRDREVWGSKHRRPHAYAALVAET
jgi:predicted amidohydrolase